MSEAMRVATSLYNDPRYYSKSEVRIRNNKRRRQQIFRRQVLLLGTAIAIVIFFFVFYFSTLLAGAQTDEYKPEFKYYKTITVHADDTLWDIAQNYYPEEHYSSVNTYMSEICSINNIKDVNHLNAGEALIVPYYSSEFK